MLLSLSFKKVFVPLFFYGLLSFPTNGMAQWNARVSAEYTTDFEGVTPYTGLEARLSHKLWDGQAYVVQGLKNQVYIYPGESQFEISDTTLGINLPLPTQEDWASGFAFSSTLEATLPISETSQRNDIYTLILGALDATHSLFEETLSLSYATYGVIFLSEYQSEASGDGIGGRPLPRYLYGISQSGKYFLSPAISADYSLRYQEITYYDLEPVTTEALSLVDLPDQTYEIRLALSWTINPNWQTALGMKQGTQILHYGTVDYVIFDEEVTMFFVEGTYRL